MFLPEPVRSKCVIVPPNALRPEEEQHPVPQLRPVQESFRLLYVGNCVATRALPLVFDALRQSRMPNTKLTIVGDGPARARWQRLAADLTAAGVVEFTGAVGRERLPELYDAAQALVFPALRDSGGSALLEAMARGVPVICLDWAGPGEMVDADSGLKVPVRRRAETVAGLVAAIVRLHGSAELRLQLARAARKRAHDLFRWHAREELLRRTYEQLRSAP
jgi:glycosyltransferase involved in cell wall biosynthesis